MTTTHHFDTVRGSHVLSVRSTPQGAVAVALEGEAAEVALDHCEQLGHFIVDELAAMLDDFDWLCALSYAVGFALHEVTRVVAKSDGLSDAEPWLALFELRGGERWALLSAGCDYTGWDCQSNGETKISASWADAVNLGMDADERARLGLSLVVG